MVRYARLFREFFRACLVEEFEYRVNFVSNVLSTVAGLVLALLTVNLFFYRADDVGGWSFYEVLALLGIFNAMQGLIAFFLQPNMTRLVSHIRTGTLDFVLLKPVNSQFYISFRHLVFWRLADVLVGFGLVVFSLWRLDYTPGAAQALQFALVFAAGVAIVYALWMGMMMFSFWAVKVDNLSFLFTSFFETARFPVSVYQGVLRLLLMYMFPVALITTFPAASLIGRLGWTETAVSLLLAAALLTAIRALWRFALRSYTSASS